jgi:hypothetical protein
MVEKSNKVASVKPFPQINSIIQQMRGRIQSLSEVMEENSQRLFGHALIEPDAIAQDRCDPVGEISTVQDTISIMDDSLIMLENRVSNFMSEI